MYKVPISMYINFRGLYSKPGLYVTLSQVCTPRAGEVLGPESASLPLWSAIRKPFTLTVRRLPVLVTGASKTLGWALELTRWRADATAYGGPSIVGVGDIVWVTEKGDFCDLTSPTRAGRTPAS